MASGLAILAMVGLLGSGLPGAQQSSAGLLAGEDLHLSGTSIRVCRQSGESGENILLFEDGFSLTVGDNRLSGAKGVIWLEAQRPAAGTLEQGSYRAMVYAEGRVRIEQGGKGRTTQLSNAMVEGAGSLVVCFLVTGQVLVTAERQEQVSCEQIEQLELYKRAGFARSGVQQGPGIPATALVPQAGETVRKKPFGVLDALKGRDAAADAAGGEPVKSAVEPVEPVYAYPVHLAAVWDPEPVIEKQKLADGQEAITISGRFYIWQKQNEQGDLIEFQADRAVLFYQSGQFETASQRSGRDIAQGQVRDVYLQGNIVMTEGQRTTRADEICYDFQNRRAIVVNAEMRVFDENRGIPIYLRAQTLRRISEKVFEAEGVTLTSSEFYFPQVSVTASQMVLLTGQALEGRQKEQAVSDEAARYDGRLYDVSAKFGDFTFFRWPTLRTNFIRPDLPLSSIRFSNDNEFGTSIETRWHLWRLLGWREQPGSKALLGVDYFSKRGPGAGVEAEYERDDAYGSVLGYIMKNRGEDDLGRADYRRNIDANQDIRGRFSLRHREYLPQDWQATIEVGYLSDRNFLEWMYRDEYYNDKGQETLIHLKRIRDNWAFSILGKGRINDFETTTEELPTIEYHLKGQSVFEHRLSWYSDWQLSRLRDRYDEDLDEHGSEKFYSYGATRNELDWPMLFGTFKLVPYVAGTYGYEDQDGFDLSLSGRDSGPEDNAVLGEAGLRASTMFWKEYPQVRSRLWDLEGLRHIVVPHFEATGYEQNESGIKMRDVVNAGVSQRWQTHRGQGQNRQAVDWLRLDVDATWVGNDADSAQGPMWNPLEQRELYGPAKFVFSDPSIPVFARRNDRYWGLVRDSVNAQAQWRVSDVTTALGDMNYDVESGVVQQFDAGLARYVYPDISFYLGSRYLRPVGIEIPSEGVYEKGSHSVVAAMTYALGSRYYAMFSQEYNFDYGKSVRSDLAIVRRYHRLYYALAVSLDQSLDRQTVSLSIWPEGVKEVSIGSRRYTGLVGAGREE